MKLTSEEQLNLMYAYDSVYGEYLKIKRSRKDGDEMKKIRLSWIKDKLHGLQKLYKKLDIPVTFKEL